MKQALDVHPDLQPAPLSSHLGRCPSPGLALLSALSLAWIFQQDPRGTSRVWQPPLTQLLQVSPEHCSPVVSPPRQKAWMDFGLLLHGKATSPLKSVSKPEGLPTGASLFTPRPPAPPVRPQVSWGNAQQLVWVSAAWIWGLALLLGSSSCPLQLLNWFFCPLAA